MCDSSHVCLNRLFYIHSAGKIYLSGFCMEERYDENVNVRKKKKRRISSRFFYLILIVSSALFFYTFYKMPMFPLKWSLIVGVLLLGMLFITGFFTMKLKPRNFFQKTVNVLLSFILFAGSVLLPYEESKISALFESVTGTTVRINIYALTNEYKNNHPESFDESNTLYYENGMDREDFQTFADYLIYGTTVSLDKDNQKYALEEINRLSGTEVKTIDEKSLDKSVDDLYSNSVDLLVMADAYASVVQDTPGYESFNTDTEVVYSFERTIESSFTSPFESSLTRKPFIVFFGGNDQTGSLSLQGRTDVDMVVAVNPNSHQIAIINLPRDSYIPNPDYDGSYDKLTHLGLTGLDNTLKGISNLLDEDVESYVLVNFDTYQKIIEALGGVTVDNPYEFTAIDGEYFPAGNIDLSPESALMYVRERYSLPGGDFDRNMHQQLVMQAMIQKITSPEGIVHFNEILDNVKDCFLTNLSSKSIYSLVSKQLDENISWNIVKYHVEGLTGEEECASAPGQYLSVVYPYENQIRFVSGVIDDLYAGNVLNQEELPEGE